MLNEYYEKANRSQVSDLTGVILSSTMYNSEAGIITFTSQDGAVYTTSNNCSKPIITGVLSNLVGSPIEQVKEYINHRHKEENIPRVVYKLGAGNTSITITWDNGETQFKRIL